MSSLEFSKHHYLGDEVWDRFVRKRDTVQKRFMEIPKYSFTDSDDNIINQEPYSNSRELYRQMLASTLAQKYQPLSWTPQWPVKARLKPNLYSPSIIMDLPNIYRGYYGCNNVVDWSVNNYLTVGFPRWVYVWDSRTQSTFRLRHKNTCCVKWSIDGTDLFLASRNGSYKYLHLKTQEELTVSTRPPCHLSCYITSCVFHPTSPIMYAGCCEGVVTAFCVNKGLHVILRIVGTTGSSQDCTITSLKLSKGGEYLAVTSMSHEILVTETTNLKVLFIIPMTAPSRVVAWHPWKVNLLVVADCRGYMALYNVLDPWEPVATYVPVFDCSIICAIFNPITAELVISQSIFVNRRGNNRHHPDPMYDPSQVSVLASFDRISDRLDGHQGAVQYLCWSPDGTQLASFGVDETTRIWDFLPERTNENSEKSKLKNYGSATIKIGIRMGFNIR